MMSMLLDSGAPAHEALSLCENDSLWAYFRKGIARMREAVAEGRTFSEAAAAQGILFSTFLWLVSIGEQNADMPGALRAIEEYESARIDETLALVQNLFGPAIVICMSLAIGFMVVSMWLPVMNVAGLI